MSSGLQQRVEATHPVLFAKVWQSPYVDLFKQLGIFQGHHCRVQGDAQFVTDPTLNKQVVCLKGSISAANLIEMPGPGATHRERVRNPSAARTTALGLTGEYMYLQLRAMADRFFSIHIDVLTTQGLTIRLSISNIFKHIKLMNHGRVLQLPCDFLSTKWTVLALHFPSLLEECSNNVASMNAYAAGHGGEPAATMNSAIKYTYSSVQRVQFCSSLYLKNVITSSHKYTISTFPKDVRFFVGKGYSFDSYYEWYWIISPPSKAQQAELAAQREKETQESKEEILLAMEEEALASVGTTADVTMVRSQPLAPEASARLFDSARGRTDGPSANSSPISASVPVNVLPFVSTTPTAPPVAPSSTLGMSAADAASIARHQPLTTAEFDDQPDAVARDMAEYARSTTLSTSESVQAESARMKLRMSQARREDADTARGGSAASDSALHPDPLLELERIIGYSASRTTRNLCWSPCGEYIIYPSNNVVIISNVKTGAQEFLTGHTACVNLVTISTNGILATGQEGKQAVIRLWNFATRQCIGILLAHNSDLRCLAFSYLNLMLAAVGRDAQGRVLIVVWDISAVLDTGKIHIVAKQLSDFGINRLIFSPFRDDPMHLLSCGHESIRFWRIKAKHLPGSSLQLNEHARNTFTDLAFEAKYGEADHTTKRMYVATAAGSLFQINYATRQLECIYKLHSGPIYSIDVNEGFCVTGSGDSFVRVWPLDFADYFLQAQHKGAITSVNISADGVNVLVGSDNGTIGMLDLGSTAYQTRMRSHLDTIYAVAFDPHRDEFATVSADGTIRIFGLHSLEQIYEFYSPHEVILCCAYHPVASEYRIACGFASGSVRIMDIATTTMHVDYQQHTGRVLDVLFSADGMFLYSNGEDGNICAYDVAKNYLPVRMFTTYRHQPVPLPPSAARMAGPDAERRVEQGKVSARIKEEHEGRSPFLSYHLDRARQEEKDLANPTPRSHHSHSHSRHCNPNGGHGSSTVPHSHAPSHATPAILPAHALAISDDGSLLATIGADPTSIVLLSTDTLRQVRLFTTASVGVARLSFAQNSRELVVVLVDQSWQRFGVEAGNLPAHIQPTPAMRFKQERAQRASGASQSDLTGLAYATAAAGSPVVSSGAVTTAAVLSPVNLWLLTGTNEGLMRVWDFHGSRAHAPLFQSFTAHQSALQPQEGITSMHFTPDGRRLLTTGGDAIWIWRVQAEERELLDQLKRRGQKRDTSDQRPLTSHPTLATHSSQTLAVGYRPDTPDQEPEEEREPPLRAAWGTNTTVAQPREPQPQQPLQPSHL